MNGCQLGEENSGSPSGLAVSLLDVAVQDFLQPAVIRRVTADVAQPRFLRPANEQVHRPAVLRQKRRRLRPGRILRSGTARLQNGVPLRRILGLVRWKLELFQPDRVQRPRPIFLRDRSGRGVEFFERVNGFNTRHSVKTIQQAACRDQKRGEQCQRPTASPAQRMPPPRALSQHFAMPAPAHRCDAPSDSMISAGALPFESSSCI